jgi:amino acid transporter
MQNNGAKQGGEGYQFGTFKGVFTPSILTILGVVMYLRVGWVLGSVGLAKTLLIVLMASSVTFLTGLSLSALATNRKVGGGGAYYIISRSLGVEIGAAVGLPLFFAQTLGISFYIAGFSEAVTVVYPELSPTVVGVVTLVVLTALAFKSADLALKSQFLVMGCIVASLFSFFIGGEPGQLSEASHAIPAGSSFWVVFAVFFPAVTGIEAGIAMSGDLKNPAKSLPLGTIGAVATGFIVYTAIPCWMAFKISDRDILLSYPMIMRQLARWGGIVVLGVWAASLSSAMGALLGAPRTLQALARDNIIPRILGRGFGKGKDPRIATVVSFLVALAGILLGGLDVIAPILSMFFLTSYGILNVSAGLEEMICPPSWRPTFRIPWPVSIVGAFVCFAIMFMINAGATLIAGSVAVGVYLLMERRSLRAWWGDMRAGLLMLVVRQAINALDKHPLDERTWKPNILVLSGSPTSRWYLIELADALSHDKGFLTVASILPVDTPSDRIASLSHTVREYLEKRGVQALVKMYAAPTPLEGARTLIDGYGYGPIVPNTIVFGETRRPENFDDFSALMRRIHETKQNLVIVLEGEDPQVVRTATRIDVWCGSIQKNLGFMLALSCLLKRSPAWKDAQLVLKTIVNSSDQQNDTMEGIEEFIAKVRIEAKAEVLVSTGSDVFKVIREQSEESDLVLLGIRSPEEEETAEAYTAYYGDLLDKVQGLPPAALVMAAEDIDFHAIFQE